MPPCLEADPCASSRVPTVVSPVSSRTLTKVQYPVIGTTNCALNQQDAKSENIVSVPKSKEGDSLKQKLLMLKDLPKKFLKRSRMVSMSSYSVSEDLTKQFMKKSIPELEPEPIPFVLANFMDIMDRDAATLDKDVLSFLASCAEA
jgi:hypothetical protein